MQIKPLPPRHYANAPITEAVINVGFELSGDVGAKDLLRLHEEIKSDYPQRRDWISHQVQMDQFRGVNSQPEHVGYQMVSADGKRMVRITTRDFAMSQLAPYDRWETLYNEGHRVWSSIERLLGPCQLNRAAVRFINRIDMPDPDGGGVDLDIYFRAAPKIPVELPQLLSTYFVRLEIPFDLPAATTMNSTPGVLILTLCTTPPPRPQTISALLDLDAVVGNAPMDSSRAWRIIEDLREVKNSAFESSITDAARELFK